jgi:phage/plasmid-like protein (TIGR03299 family)
MSAETSKWLNTRTLIGFTEKRGEAWHYRAEEQGGEPNHYPLAIPVADVERRLFNWEAKVGEVHAEVTNPETLFITDYPGNGRKAIIRPGGALGKNDPGAIIGMFKAGYEVHQYREWLLGNVATILDDKLSIGSAGLLKGGAVAWVSVEVPESVTTPEGVTFRPNLIATTSHDGSLSSTFKRVVTIVVCDNTLSAGLGEQGQQVKVKHSTKSLGRIDEVREALNIVYTTADDFAAEVAELCQTEIDAKQWQAFLDAYAPIPEDDGRGKTVAGKKQDALKALWNNDPRCSPWRGNAFGVVQTVNTYVHHVIGAGGKKDADRPGRNMMRAIATGAEGIDALDNGTLSTLRKVLV